MLLERGVIDQDVERAELSDNLADGVATKFGIRHVAGNQQGAAAGPFDFLPGPLRVDLFLG